MANARSKKKAKSGSKSKAKKPAAKKKVVARAAKSKSKPKVKAKAKKAPAKAKASKPAPKPAKTTGPKLPRVLAPEVSNALAQAEVEGLISRLPPPVQPVVKMLRKVVLEVAPEASEQIENGAPAYFANGVFARIEPGEHDVLVRFLKGGKLPSAAELPGDGDARVITFQDADALKETVLRKVVREAVMLNLSDAASTPTAEA